MNTNTAEERTYTAEGFVTISINKYDDLIATVTDFETFIDLVLRTSQLNYLKDDLRIDEEFVKAYIKSIDEFEYNERLKELKGEENERNSKD